MKTSDVEQIGFVLFATVLVIWPATGKADSFTKEEQALIDKGMTMEMFKPNEHSRHFIAHIESVIDSKTGKSGKTAKTQQSVVCFVFGIEDAQPAREEGRSMAECHYSPDQAHEFLFAEGWDKYRDRFFTRCYVQEGEAAYNEAVNTRQKPTDPASTS